MNMTPNDLNIGLTELKRKKEIHFEPLDRAFHVEILQEWDEGDPVEIEEKSTFLDSLRNTLIRKMKELEASRVVKLDKLYETLLSVCEPTLEDIPSLTKAQQSEDDVEKAQEKAILLNSMIAEYFESRVGDVDIIKPWSPPQDSASMDDSMKAARWGFKDPDLVERSQRE
jgi:hypothetical protein